MPLSLKQVQVTVVRLHEGFAEDDLNHKLQLLSLLQVNLCLGGRGSFVGLGRTGPSGLGSQKLDTRGVSRFRDFGFGVLRSPVNPVEQLVAESFYPKSAQVLNGSAPTCQVPGATVTSSLSPCTSA